MSQETISIIAIIISIISLLVSLSSFILSFLNFRRDAYKVQVSLDWDAGRYYVGMQSNVKEIWGHIYVINKGRRPVYIRLVGIKYPDQEHVYNLLEDDKADGLKLSEGDAPLVIKVSHDARLKKYSNDWQKLYAVAYDNRGKEYKSQKLWNRPSWAK